MGRYFQTFIFATAKSYRDSPCSHCNSVHGNSITTGIATYNGSLVSRCTTLSYAKFFRQTKHKLFCGVYKRKRKNGSPISYQRTTPLNCILWNQSQSQNYRPVFQRIFPSGRCTFLPCRSQSGRKNSRRAMVFPS